MPQKIDITSIDNPLDTQENNIRRANKYLVNKHKKLEKNADGINLYEFPYEYVAIDEQVSPPKIIFYLNYHFENLAYLRIRPAASIRFMWKSKEHKETSGLPLQVYLSGVLAKTGTIISAQQHTEDAKKFMLYAVRRVLSEGKFVYYINFLFPNDIQQITALTQLTSMQDTVWGIDEEYRQRRIIITNHQLRL